MSILVQKKLVEYNSTPNYGLITEKSTCLDDLAIFNEFLISYRLHKIRCWQNKQLGIIGVQLYYKDRETNEEVISMNKSKNIESTLIEFILEPLEFLTGFTVWKTNILTGFSIVTNRHRIKKFGYELGDKIIPEGFEDDSINVILGFFFTFEPNIVVSSMGCYYLNKKYFFTILFSGILRLRVKLKDEKFRKDVESKLDTLDKAYIALYKTCLLPSMQFYGILRFALA